MRLFLWLLFSAILAAMLFATVVASLDRGLFQAARELMPDRWFQATLLDAYFGFLTVYVWVVYRESSIAARAIWFVLFMTLGNIAISVYVLLQLYATRGEPAASLFQKKL